MPHGHSHVRRRALMSRLPAFQISAARSPLDVTAVAMLSQPGASYSIIRVKTRIGITGYGECPHIDDALFRAAAGVISGKPATAYEVIHRDLMHHSAARGGINMALLDVVGKLVKAPIYQVLGGPTRNKVRAMTRITGESDDQLIASMKSSFGRGYRAFIVPVPSATALNQGKAFALAVSKRMGALRAAGGEDVDFVVDCGGSLSPGDAATVCSVLEPFHPLWVDEPCATANLKASGKLAGERVTPIGFRSEDYQNLLRDEVIDILRPDISVHGISEIRRMAALAETYYTAVAPWHEGGPIATAAALHLAASLPNFFIQQIPSPERDEERKQRAAIAGLEIEQVRDGFVSLPSGPGLGITVDEKSLKLITEVA